MRIIRVNRVAQVSFKIRFVVAKLQGGGGGGRGEEEEVNGLFEKTRDNPIIYNKIRLKKLLKSFFEELRFRQMDECGRYV